LFNIKIAQTAHNDFFCQLRFCKNESANGAEREKKNREVFVKTDENDEHYSSEIP
jgi:hypothetical protein